MTRFPYKVIDLSHTLSSTNPTWDGSCGFEHHLNHDYDQTALYKFKTHKIHMSEGIGTHIDSPAHCFSDGKTIDDLPLSDLIAPCVVIDVSDVSDAHYSVSVNDIATFEKSYGTIQQGSFVMIRTGWERFWNDPEKYRNDHHFPSVSKEAAEVFLSRGIAALGIDTLSPDRPEDGFEVHRLLLGSGKVIVENATNLSGLPVQGSFIMALPIKTEGGTEAPVRLAALIDRNDRQKEAQPAL